LITDLSKIAGLFVIARNSSFAFKGQSVDVKDVGQRLGVRHVLEGSVRRAGNRVRINAQLIDAGTGGHLWAERYDGDLEEIFELQDAITGKIVSALEVTLSDRETQNRLSKYVPKWDAYDNFIRGRQSAHEGYFRRTARAIDRPDQSWLAPAKELFERTITLDPEFAGGYAGLSWTYSVGIRHGLTTSPNEDSEEAYRLAVKAIETDDTFGWSHTAMASAQLMRGQFDDAVAAARHAVEVQPSDADTHAYLGLCLILSGMPHMALPYLDTAIRLDPRYHTRTLNWRGYALFGMRRYDAAVEILEEVIRPNGISIHFNFAYLAASYQYLGRINEARETITKLLERHPNFTISKSKNLMRYKQATDTDHLCDGLRKAGLPE
jgi:adenylate cyclase